MEKKKEEIVNEKMRKKIHTKTKKSPAPKKGMIRDLLPEIDGHKVTLNQWLAFKVYMETANGVNAAKAGNVTPKAVYQWRGTNWWKMLYRSYIESSQDSFLYKMMKASDKVFKTYIQLLEGNFKDPKAANAAAKMVELFLRVGKGGMEPIMSSKPFIEIHKTNINVELNADKVEMIWNKMTDDERNEFGISAHIPDKYLGDLSDDTEVFEEIEITEAHLEMIEGGDIDETGEAE